MSSLSQNQIKSIDLLRKYFPVVVFLIVVGVFSILGEQFRTWTNITNIGKQSAVLIVAALGETLVILAGSIDLSVGSLLGLSSVLTAGATRVIGDWAILVGPIVGLTAGVCSGILFAKGRIPSFIVTLAMLTILRGFVLIYTKGQPIWLQSDLVKSIAEAEVFSFPGIFVVACCFFGLMYLVDEYTPFGRRIRAIGGDEKVARLSGIKIARTYIYVFAASGFLVGCAGVLQSSRSAAGIPTTGTGFELDVIASVVLGGTTLTGGVGGVLGTIMGALTMTALSSGLNIIGVSPYGQYVVKGLVLMAAVFISIDRNKIGIIK